MDVPVELIELEHLSFELVLLDGGHSRLRLIADLLNRGPLGDV